MSRATILDTIIERKWQEIKSRSSQRSVSDLLQQAAQQSAPRGFVAAIQARLAADQSAVIAEIKKASPSKGIIRPNFDPVAIAESYQRGGACCLSVLTDRDFFKGDERFLTEARQACELPVIRKDFIVDPYQIVEARAIAADCILLIAAALDDIQMAELYAAAQEQSLDVLIEVHDREELDRILPLGSTLIGINNRDLHRFETSLDNTYQLLPYIPEDRIVVTESGIHNSEHIAAMRAHGVNSFLVGEAFMRADDPGARLAELFFK